MTTYKYRIVQITPSKFKAQYKTFLIWWNLTYTRSCHYDGCTNYTKYFKSAEDAEEAMKTSIRIWCEEEQYNKDIKENYPKVPITGQIDC